MLLAGCAASSGVMESEGGTYPDLPARRQRATDPEGRQAAQLEKLSQAVGAVRNFIVTPWKWIAAISHGHRIRVD